MKTVSVIIPVFNEERVIANCFASLAKQTVTKDMEIIVIDDGSTDNSKSFASLHQEHKGPGAARNLGATKAIGNILVFVDADMEFETDFIEKLTKPIIEGKTIGTFSKEEYLLNKNNIWARYWNQNLARDAEKMLPDNYPDESPVFRAILKSKFNQAEGFNTQLGYTDDWSISRKLNVLAVAARGAKFYHRNPETLAEVWSQARWFGKNEFLTKNLLRKLYNLHRYSPLLAIRRITNLNYFIFTIIYNSAVSLSVLLSFFGENKNK